MLPIQTTLRLRQLGIEASKAEDFGNGLNLLHLVCQIYYNGDNPALASKIKWSDEQKTGNKVVNINIILNHLKKDTNIQLPQQIRELTAFKVIEEPQHMMTLVDFLISQAKHNKNSSIVEMSPPRQQENQLENLYFAASLEKKNHIDDSLEIQNGGDQVVRKGSFKMLRPKVSSESKLKSSDSKEMSEQPIKEKGENKSENKQPLKELYSVDEANRQPLENQQEANRKTIPKMYEKPPLYRSRQKQSQQLSKQKNQSLKDSKRHTPTMTASQTDRQTIVKNIQHITNQIAEEQKSLNLLNNSITYPKPQIPKAKTSRKIFRLELPDIGEPRKKILVEWLVNINIISLSTVKFAFNLHNICKDGVIFMEVVNYYRGRGRNICFFKQPKRPAEMHSNYQKLFALLQDVPEFRSQLLNQYQYFIPFAQPNAFWNFLSSIHLTFCKDSKTRNNSINRYENSVSRAVENASSKRKRINDSISYQDIKFNAESHSKESKEVKSNFSSVQAPRKETPKPVSKMKSQESQTKQAPYGLIQNQQPVEQNNRTERGYKEMYLCKFKNLETPSKNRSFSNSSLSKSRMRSSLDSAKKNQAKPVIPSITLEMQMAVLKYLNALAVPEEQELFKDPYRNGTLLCSIVKKQMTIECFASRKPRSIDDCRNNFLTAIEAIKNRRKSLKVNYQYFVEDLVKGERSLLYGLVWSILKECDNNSKQPFSSIEIEDKPVVIHSEQEKLSWVRAIEKHSFEIASMKIRNQETLYNMMVNSDFLFHYAWMITGKKAVLPSFERPFNNIQREANLKKVLSYFVQCKIIRSDYLWKSKALLKREGNTLEELANDLSSHYSRIHKKEQSKSVNFIRYMKRQESQELQKPQQKLQTTMANQTVIQTQLAPPQPQLEINWMRKLGFTGSLELNNGVLLCRIVAKLGMKTVQGVNQNPQSRAECLGNIRRAIKHLPKFKWDEYDIEEANYNRTIEIYSFLRDQYRHSYALKSIQ